MYALPLIIKTLNARSRADNTSVGDFNLELTIILQNYVKITFGDGSYLQITPTHIYSETRGGIEMKIIRGNAMFQASTPGSWCGFLDLSVKLVPYEPSDTDTPGEQNVLTRITNFISSNPPKLLSSTRRYQIPQWWSEVPVEYKTSWGTQTNSLIHRNTLENTYWPIENFEKIKTLALSRILTMG